MKKKFIHLALLFSLTASVHNVYAKDAMEREVSCLAQNIYYEAGAEPRKGKIAVGQVTLNRLKHENYPSTVCGVVHQKKKQTCQFSWVCWKGRPAIKHDSHTWQESKEIAGKLLQHGKVDGMIFNKSMLYFHATYVRPYWADKMRYVTRIGKHIFYRERPAVAG